MRTRLLLVDDHQIVRQALRGLLEGVGFEVVAEAADGREAVLVSSRVAAEVAILDLAMPSLNGLDAAREILRSVVNLKVILLTMHTEERYVLEALQAGVSGYVLKSQAADDLVRAIQEVVRGAIYLCPAIARPLVDAYRRTHEKAANPLSHRERQVLQLVAEGKTTKEVAVILQISVKTAETHRTHIMSKLDIHETASLVRYAIRAGLIQP